MTGRARFACLAALASACGPEPTAKPPPIKFLHTFGPEETELFNATMAERGLAVESSLVPFARGQQVIGEILQVGSSCPDLIRIDATWLPGLLAELLPAPPALAGLDWTPEAAALVVIEPFAGETAPRWWAVPQSVDGLVVVRDRRLPAPATPRIEDLVAAARTHRAPTQTHPLGLRADGYWLVPWLRAEGAELAVSSGDGAASTGIDDDGAVRALATFSALFGDVAAPPPPAGSEAPDELRRWNAGELAYWVTGPWQLGAARDRDRIAVSPLARAPRGGQLLVVPKCARRPSDGWKLAAELTDVAVAVRFADAFGTVPTRTSALAATSTPLARALYDALKAAEPLPRDPRTPLLFDDLNPALAAVIAHDATPDEAIAGVRRSWRRLASGTQAVRDPDSPPTEAPDTRTPDSRTPDSRTPDSRTPDSRTPDTRTPETRTPDNRTPDSRIPDSRTPDSRTPDTRTPDNRTPDSRTPDTRTPDVPSADAGGATP